MQEAYIVSAVRTPLGKFGGILAKLSPVQKNRHLGLAAVCHGSGGGTAIAIERLR